MTAADFATAGFINDWFLAIQARLDQLANPQARPGGVAEMLSVEEVMERLNCSRSTVQRWYKVGKEGRTGANIKLQVLWFSPSEPRIPVPALLAFGQGLPFDLGTLQGIAPPQPKSAPTVQEQPQMRVA